MSKNLEQAYENFTEEYNSKINTVPWFLAQFKTHLSKNITLEDWNSLQKNLQNIISDDEAIKKLLDSIFKYLSEDNSYTDKKIDELIANLKSSKVSIYSPSYSIVQGDEAEIRKRLTYDILTQSFNSSAIIAGRKYIAILDVKGGPNKQVKLFDFISNAYYETPIIDSSQLTDYNTISFSTKSYYDKAKIDSLMLQKADKSKTYTKTEVDNKIWQVNDDMANNYMELESMIEETANEVTNKFYDTLETKADLVDGKVPVSQLPSYVDDVIEFDKFVQSASWLEDILESEIGSLIWNNTVSSNLVGGTSNPYYKVFVKNTDGTAENLKIVSPEFGKIYVNKSNSNTYRWSGSNLVEISKSIGLGESSSTAYPGNKGKANADAIAELQTQLDTKVEELEENISDLDNIKIEIDSLTAKNNIKNYQEVLWLGSDEIPEIPTQLPFGSSTDLITFLEGLKNLWSDIDSELIEQYGYDRVVFLGYVNSIKKLVKCTIRYQELSGTYALNVHSSIYKANVKECISLNTNKRYKLINDTYETPQEPSYFLEETSGYSKSEVDEKGAGAAAGGLTASVSNGTLKLSSNSSKN